jgi:hypothetical protein
MSDDVALTPYEEAELESYEAAFTPAHYRAFENALCLRAYVTGWTGDPLKQPAGVVLSAARQVMAETSATV